MRGREGERVRRESVRENERVSEGVRRVRRVSVRMLERE